MRAHNLLPLALILFAGCSDKFEPSVQEKTISPVAHSRAEQLADKESKQAATGKKAQEAKLPGPEDQTSAVRPEVAELLKKASESPRAESSHSLSSGSANRNRRLRKSAQLAPLFSSNQDFGSGRYVHIGGMRLTAPEGWVRQKPPIKFILAAFTIAKAEGDPRDAQVTITATSKDTPENRARLREQLKKKPKGGEFEQLTISGVPVILTQSVAEPQKRGPFNAPGLNVRFKMLNAVVPLGGYIFFITCAGPERTVEQHVKEFRQFLFSMQPLEKAPDAGSPTQKEQAAATDQPKGQADAVEQNGPQQRGSEDKSHKN